jgi:hypothetical protein
MRRFRAVTVLVAVAVVLGPAAPAGAHGLIGKRFFPATLGIDDPFVADELSLPTILHIKRRGDAETPATRETDIRGELSKRLTPDLGLGVGGALVRRDPDEGKSVSGFDNLEVSLKYVFFKSPAHETLLTFGLDWDVGGTGDKKKIGAESFDTVTPQILFGKGFGDLPERLELLQPLALTGLVGAAVPTKRNEKRVTLTTVADPDTGEVRQERDVEREFNPVVMKWGFTVQYNLQYLQSFVRDIGLPNPFRRMIPLVEFVMQTPVEGRDAGRTTGTINPGVIWFGRYLQIGLEAVVPVNERSGKNVGVLGQLHFYLDDIAPRIFTWTPFHGTLGPAVPR